MTSGSDRPTPRTRLRPAEDETSDPVVSRPPVRRGPEPTVQLNVRIAADVSALLDQQAASTGRTKRQLIEAAIRTTCS